MKQRYIDFILSGLIFYFSTTLTGQSLPLFKLEEKQLMGENEGITEVTSLLELPDHKLWVLEARQGKIRIFSKEGKLINTFGSIGEGPGEFRHPEHLSQGPHNTVYLCESRDNISRFSNDGHFIKRLFIKEIFGPHFIKSDRFIAWRWKEKAQECGYFDGSGNVIQSLLSREFSLFSISAPDETGRLMMFRYTHYQYTPQFIYSSRGESAAAGRSDSETIFWLKTGSSQFEPLIVRHDPPVITPKQREKYMTELDEISRLTPEIKNKFKRLIPKNKNRIAALTINSRGLFVFLFNDQINENGLELCRVDLAEKETRYKWPLTQTAAYTSEKYIYCIEDKNEETVIIRYVIDQV